MRAQNLMCNPDYELAKKEILKGTNEGLETLSSQIGNKQNRSASIFFDIFKKILFCIGCFAIFLFAVYYIMRHWIVTPLAKYNESIKRGKIFPVCGAYELQLLADGFRSIDHVCRIGGDEFAVVMMDVTGNLGYTIEDKIGEINKQLAKQEENAPAVSLSVGAAFADQETPGESLFKDADLTLYYVKEHGRNGCRIYSAEDAAIVE